MWQVVANGLLELIEQIGGAICGQTAQIEKNSSPDRLNCWGEIG